ncbi:MAG: oligosaccharide flippase family protein [Mesorhizobium sp.]
MTRLVDRNRHFRLALSVVASVGGQFVSLIAPLILMPAMLRYLGVEAFGIWAASIAITGVTAFLDIGIGSGLLSRLANACGLKDYIAARRYIASAYAVLACISIVCLSALLLATLAGIGLYFEAPTTWPIVAAVLASFFISMPAVLIYRILQATLRIPLQSILQSLGAFGSVATCLAAMHFNAAPWVVVTAYSITPVAVMILASFWLFSWDPRIRPQIVDFSGKEMRNLMGFGSSFFFLSILTAIGTNADILIISHVAGPEAVANFVPPMRLGSVLVLLIGQLFMPLWSFNAEAMARGDVAWVRRTTLMMSIGGATLVLLCGGAMVALSDHIMMLWMHRTFENQDMVLIAMTAASAVIAFTSPFSMVLNAKGFAREQISPWLAFVLISIAIKLLVVTKDGTWMAPAVTFGCYLAIVMPAMVYRARKSIA